jgi:hypothetical protein
MKGVTASTGHNWRFKNEIGKRFGRLIVVSLSDNKGTSSVWNCLCDCGNEVIVLGAKLRNGHTQSCGCFRVEIATFTMTAHGDTCGHVQSPEYKTWTGMKRRCLRAKAAFYLDYGGRGISVCDRWLKSFENFLKDMGRKPSDSHSIDRIDVNGNYEPSNCRWATVEEQAVNRRNNKFIEHLGRRLTYSQWERVLGLKPGIVSKRIRSNIHPLKELI